MESRFPDYWLPRPPLELSPDTESALAKLYETRIAPGGGGWLEPPLPAPAWLALCWLAEQRGVLLHGSRNPEIREFESRVPHDRSADEFSKQPAVYAASDGIWAIFYAILDRGSYPLRFLNAALRFELAPGLLTPTHYFFSVTRELRTLEPWCDGVVYLLPSDGFVQQPPYELAGHRVHEPHWAHPGRVRPLAKVPVSPGDFTLLAEIRGHDPSEIDRRAALYPHGFPWLDET